MESVYEKLDEVYRNQLFQKREITQVKRLVDAERIDRLNEDEEDEDEDEKSFRVSENDSF